MLQASSPLSSPTHYENMPMQNTVISKVVKMKIFSRKKKEDTFLIFTQNIDCGYSLEPHSLCFGAKIRKTGIPLHTPVLLYKSRV